MENSTTTISREELEELQEAFNKIGTRNQVIKWFCQLAPWSLYGYLEGERPFLGLSEMS